jgi:DNA repair exonuclease SbcCD ATPase subunit
MSSNVIDIFGSNELTAPETEERDHHEGVVDSVIGGIQQLSQIGDASLKVLRDKRLYRSTHATFEEYCQERFGFKGNYAHKRVAFAEVLDALCTRVHKLPATEGQARSLSKLPTSDLQAEAWENAQTATGKDQPSASAVSQSVEELLAKIAETEARANQAEMALDEAKQDRDSAWEREKKADAKARERYDELIKASAEKKALKDEFERKLQAQQQAVKDAESVHREHLDEMRVRIAEEERNRPRTDEEVAKHRAEIKKLKDEEATIQIAINESTKERQKLEAELLDARKAIALRDKVLSDFGQAAIRFRDDCIRMTGVAEALRSIPITDELYSQIETVRALAREVLQAMEDATSVSV